MVSWCWFSTPAGVPPSEEQNSPRCIHLQGFHGCLDGKESAVWKTWFDPWVAKIPWRREWLPILVFLPVESYGQRNLTGCISWGHKESDTTEQLSHLKIHRLTHTQGSHLWAGELLVCGLELGEDTWVRSVLSSHLFH